MKLLRDIFFLIALALVFFQGDVLAQGLPKLDLHSLWVDQTFNHLSKKEKIAQLFMVAAYSNKGQEFTDSVGKIIRKNQPGGIIFFQGGPIRQSILLNQYQESLKVPALVALDAEWGLGMRLDSTQSFPYQMSLGAIQGDRWILEMGREIGRQLKRIGVQVNFAPVLDINNNYKNSVINFRSFGDRREMVSAKGIAYIQGLQEMNILATGKHFPGHGDTEVDSHKDMPILPFSRSRLDSLELFPFKMAVNSGIGGMMIAHMNVLAFDTNAHLPSSLSENIIQGALKKDLGFQGLIFTDAMNMKGVLKYYPTGTAELMALKAGNDMVEMSLDLKKSIKMVKRSIRKGEITWESIENRTRKILAWKEYLGLSRFNPVKLENLPQDLHTPKSDSLIQRLSDLSITLLRDRNFKDNYLTDKESSGIILSINPGPISILDSELASYYQLPKIQIPRDLDSIKVQELRKKLKDYDYVLILAHDSRPRPGSSLHYSKALNQFLNEESSQFNRFLVLLGNPYAFLEFPKVKDAYNLLVTYQDSPYTERSTLKFLKGNLRTQGKLPVEIPGLFYHGEGIRYRR